MTPTTPQPQDFCQCGACSATVTHWSDCAVHNEYAARNGPCDCGAEPAPTKEGDADVPDDGPDDVIARFRRVRITLRRINNLVAAVRSADQRYAAAAGRGCAMSDPYDVDPLAEVLRISDEYRAEIVEFRRVLGEIVACDAEAELRRLAAIGHADGDSWPALKTAMIEARALLETGPPPAPEPEPAQLPPEVAALRLQAFAITRNWVHAETHEPASQTQLLGWADDLVKWALRKPDAGKTEGGAG